MTPTDSSFSFTPPVTPSTHTQPSTQERWQDLITTYRQAVSHVRQIEDEMMDLRFGSEPLYPSLQHETPTTNCQNYRLLDHQGFYDNNCLQPTSPMWKGTHILPNLLQGTNHVKLELDETVELSVVTLDTLRGKKTMISLTAKSAGADLKQLLGFWEFDLLSNK